MDAVFTQHQSIFIPMDTPLESKHLRRSLTAAAAAVIGLTGVGSSSAGMKTITT